MSLQKLKGWSAFCLAQRNKWRRSKQDRPWVHDSTYGSTLNRSPSKQNGKSLAFFNVYALDTSSCRDSEVGKHSIGYRGGGTNRRQTKDRRPWVHDSTYRPPSIIRLDERKIYSPFSPQLGQSVSSGSGSRKDVVGVLYRNGERDRAKAMQNPDILGRESILSFSCRPRHRRNEHSPGS